MAIMVTTYKYTCTSAPEENPILWKAGLFAPPRVTPGHTKSEMLLCFFLGGKQHRNIQRIVILATHHYFTDDGGGRDGNTRGCDAVGDGDTDGVTIACEFEKVPVPLAIGIKAKTKKLLKSWSLYFPNGFRNGLPPPSGVLS